MSGMGFKRTYSLVGFKAIIEAAYDNFFVDATVEPVADYRAFLRKLRSLDRITELSAKGIHPIHFLGASGGVLMAT